MAQNQLTEKSKDKSHVFVLQDSKGFHVVLRHKLGKRKQVLKQGQTRKNGIPSRVTSDGLSPTTEKGPLVEYPLKSKSLSAAKLIDCYLYIGTLHITERNVLSVLEISLRLGLTAVQDACMLLLSKSLTFGNWNEVFCLSINYRNNSLKNALTKFMTQHISKCFTRKDLLTLAGSLTRSKYDRQSLKFLLRRCHSGRKTKNTLKLMSEVLSTEAKMWGCCFKEYLKNDNSQAMKTAAHNVHNAAITNNNTQGHAFSNNVLTHPSSLQTSLPYFPAKTKTVFSQGIVVAGGMTDAKNPKPIDSVFMYDPISSRWCALPSMTRPRYNHSLVAINGIVFAMGGNTTSKDNTLTKRDISISDTILNSSLSTQTNSVEEFSMELNHWVEILPMILSREEHSSVVVKNQVFTLGGHDGVSQLCSVEKYDLASSRWSLEKPMARLHTGAGAATDGRYIYVIGGYDGITWSNSLECYDTLTKTWSRDKLCPMSERRGYAGVEMIRNDIFVFGGTNGRENLKSCEVFNVSVKEWRKGPPLNQARLNAAHCVLNGNVLVMGGECDGRFLDVIEQLDVNQWEWRILDKLPIKVAGLKCAVVSQCK